MFDIMEGRSPLFMFNSKMAKRLSLCSLESLTPMPYASFLEKIGKCGPKTAMFLLEYSGFVVFDRCPKMETFIIPSGYITDVNFALIKLLRHMKQNPLPIPAPQLEKVLSTLSEDQKVVDTLFSMVKTSDLFQTRTPKEGPQEYCMDWEHLDKTTSQIERIVSDAGKPLFVDEMISEFRRRSISCGMPVPDLTPKLIRQCGLLKTDFPGGALGLKSWLVEDENLLNAQAGSPSLSDEADSFSPDTAENVEAEAVSEEVPTKQHRTSFDKAASIRMIAECIHKKGGRAKLTEIKSYVHENSGSVIQVSRIKELMDEAPDLFKVQASKIRNAFYILRRPVDGVDFEKYR